ADRVHARRQMLVLTAHERLVRFDLTGERHEGFGFHRETDAVEHEPRRFLRDAERASEFVRAGAVLGIREQPEGREPLSKRNRRVLKDRADLDAKLPFALLAAPLGASESPERTPIRSPCGGKQRRWASATGPRRRGRDPGPKSR